MAQKLASIQMDLTTIRVNRRFFEVDPTYTRLHEPDELLCAYRFCCRREAKAASSGESFTGIVSHKIVSVGSKVAFILRRLIRGQKQRLGLFFEIALPVLIWWLPFWPCWS